MVPIDCRKPNLFEDHSTRSQLPDWPNQSIYVAAQGRTPLVRVQRILRYVSGTKDRALLYQTGIVEQLVGYTDVDWAGNAGDRRSTSRFTLSLWIATIAWSSKQ